MRACAWGSIAAAVIVAALMTAEGCRGGQASPRRNTAPVPAASPSEASAAPPGLAPLHVDDPLRTIAVPGYEDTPISVPQGARGPKPVIVATHGMWDWAKGMCDNWRWIVGDRAWVICPVGKPMPDKTSQYAGPQALLREIDAGLRALAEAYPGYVDEDGMLYTGFSHGANLGVWIVTHDAKRFPRAVLTEGGEGGWSAAAARKYGEEGGGRVLFACGQRGNYASSSYLAKVLSANGVPARSVLGKLPDAGQFMHWYNGPVAEETKAQLDWLFEGDERWREQDERSRE